MNEKEIASIEDRYMANVYSKRNLVITKGKGALLWDINGKEYIDCMSAYGVCVVGHSHPRIVDAIKRQVEDLISCHGSFYNDARSELLYRIKEITPRGLDVSFLSNSGTEAVECALKLARKFTGKSQIIAMMGGYHGKTMGALSTTWKKKYRTPFEPLIPDVKHIPFGRSNRVKEAITEKTAVIIVEPIQGEGGIKIPPEEYLIELREICDEEDILLIFDEVQTGFGRTGKIFACEHWSVIPDIMCISKAVAGGMPMGITVARDNIMSSFKTGDHTSTFGGNPLACKSATAAIDVLIEEKLADLAAVNGKYLMEKLEGLKDKYNIIREVRGLGLMIGIEMRFDVLDIILQSQKRGVILLDAGRNILRLLPPLVIKQKQLDRVVQVLDQILREK